MKIVVVNKFYYNRGGDCIATMALEEALREQGHEVAIFSMQYPLNKKSCWSDYFAPQVDFSSFYGKLKALFRVFKPQDVKNKFLQLLKDFNPDIVHLNNIHSYISPYIAELAYSAGIKVVWTLHDYKLICPSYVCLSNGDICEKCIDAPINVLKNKCMKGSLSQSFIGYLEYKYWNRKRLNNFIDYYITPSVFMRDLMIKAGLPSEKVIALPHYMSRNMNKQEKYLKENYYCFVGRFSIEKGVITLIKAALNLPYKLIMIGDGPLVNDLKFMASECNNISFVGYCEWDKLKEIVGKARFIVTPSEWYEVFGLVNIEAQALGTPVLGANIGGIPETIVEGKTGMLFESKNENDLKSKIQKMFLTDFDYDTIAKVTKEKYSVDVFYSNLIEIYRK